MKEVKANVDGLNAGVVTMQDIQANYGRDVEELFEQHQREEELAKQAEQKKKMEEEFKAKQEAQAKAEAEEQEKI